MATGDISAVRINASGWYAEVDITGLAIGGTYAFGLGTYNNPSSAKMVFSVTSQGYTAAGVLSTMTRTVYGIDYKRKVYPDNASADETTGSGKVTLLVALSDWIYSADTLTVNIGSGFYTSSGTPNNSVTGLAVTNNSAEVYPKVVGNWTWPGYERITGSTFKVRCVAFHRSARQGSPVRCVKFTATDEHSNSVSVTVTAPTIDTTMADEVPVVEYIGTIPTTNLTQGDVISVNFVAYPWYGNASSILDTGDGVNGTPTPLYSTRRYLCDKTGAYGVTIAVVDSVNGGNDIGVAVDSASFDPDNPPAAFLNIYAAANAIAAYNNTNHARNNCAAGIIYLKAGSHNFTGGTVSAGGQASGPCWCTITKFPGTTRASVIISSASTTKQVSENLKVEDVTITNSTTYGFTGMNALWVHNCDVNPSGTGTFYANTVFYITHCNIGDYNVLQQYSTVNGPRAIIRGNLHTALFGYTIRGYVVVGNNFQMDGSAALAGYSANQTVPAFNNIIIAFNKIKKTNTTSALINFYTGSAAVVSETHGFAFVQNILERLGTGSNVLITLAADGSTIDTNPINNVLFWHNTIVGHSANLAYNDYSLNDIGPAYRKHWSIIGNIFDDYNCVTDIDTHGSTANASRYGNHSIIHGVGSLGNIILNQAGTAAYENKCGGLMYQRGAPLAPYFINDQSLSGGGLGDGDYSLLSASPARNKITSTAAVLPYDFLGIARKNDGTGAAGALEYNGATTTSTTTTTTTTTGSTTTSSSATTTTTLSTTTTSTTIPVAWYVNNSVTTSGNGQSWGSAWKNFSNIVWGTGGVQPGHVVYISGGSTSKTYSEQLTIGNSGTLGSTIKIRPGSASPSPAGHDGTVIISGGQYGIRLQGRKYIDINGEKNGSINIKVLNTLENGIYLTGASYGVEVAYVWVQNCSFSGAYEYANNAIGCKDINVSADQYPVLDVHHCYIYRNYRDGIAITSESGSPAYEVFDRYLIHHNVIEDTNGDPIQQRVRGVSIYNNTIFHTWSGGVGTAEHPDGMELYRGYCKAYNNLIYNLHDVLGTEYGSTAYISIAPGVAPSSVDESHYYVFNNLIIDTDPLQDWMVGITCTNTNAPALASISDVYIFNNTIIGVPGYAMNFYWNSILEGAPENIQNYVIVNNIIANCGRNRNSAINPEYVSGISYGSDGDNDTLTIDYNIINSGEEGNNGFLYNGSNVPYATFKSSHGIQDHPGAVENSDPLLDSNYRPTISSPVIGAGKNMDFLGLASRDKDGKIRGSVWDIGCFQYAAGAATTTTTTTTSTTTTTTTTSTTGTGTTSTESTTTSTTGSTSTTDSTTSTSTTTTTTTTTITTTSTTLGWPNIPNPTYPIKEKTHFPIFKSQTDAPYRVVRKKWTSHKKSWILEWDESVALIESDYQILEAFFLANQGASFYWEHPFTGIAYYVTFDMDELIGDFAYPGYRTTTVNLREE